MVIPEFIEPEGEFAYLVNSLNPSKTPVEEQISLFSTIQDKILQQMPRLLTKYKRKSAIIKYLSKKYEIERRQARKYFEEAFQKFALKLNYEHYVKNKEYFEWVKTPEGQEYILQQIQEYDERAKKYQDDLQQNIEAGKEHIVKIVVNDAELVKVLDNPLFARIDFQGPLSSLLKRPGITKHDMKILIARKYITILKGNPDTILNYDFPAKRTEDNIKRYWCTKCGAILDYNDIGLNKKLGITQERYYKCPRCLGLSHEEEESIINFYKSNGCNMFI